MKWEGARMLGGGALRQVQGCVGDARLPDLWRVDVATSSTLRCSALLWLWGLLSRSWSGWVWASSCRRFQFPVRLRQTQLRAAGQPGSWAPIAKLDPSWPSQEMSGGKTRLSPSDSENERPQCQTEDNRSNIISIVGLLEIIQVKITYWMIQCCINCR